MNLRLGFDVDGVLADFRTAFETTAGRVLRRPLDRTDDPEALRLSNRDLERVWKAIGESHNWWASLAACEPSQIPRLYELTRTARWEVVFLTKRPPSAGDTVQFQTQWWLEHHGFLMPSVVTVPGSRGEVANALRLDLIVDDQFVNCAEIVGASTTKTVLLLRAPSSAAARDHALARGIGVVASLEEAIGVIERLHHVLPKRRGRLLRLTDWFLDSSTSHEPLTPRSSRPPLSEP